MSQHPLDAEGRERESWPWQQGWQGTSLVNCGPSVLTAESYWVINSGNGELSLKVGDDTNSGFRHTAVQGGWQKWVARC